MCAQDGSGDGTVGIVLGAAGVGVSVAFGDGTRVGEGDSEGTPEGVGLGVGNRVGLLVADGSDVTADLGVLTDPGETDGVAWSAGSGRTRT